MNHYTSMSDEEIARYTYAHQSEAGCNAFDPAEFLAAVGQGVTVIERRDYGFAVVNPCVARGIAFTPAHLWLIYIDPQHRAQGRGRKLLREVIKKYADGHAITAMVHGAERAGFFERCGFRETFTDEADDWRRMQYR